MGSSSRSLPHILGCIYGVIWCRARAMRARIAGIISEKEAIVGAGTPFRGLMEVAAGVHQQGLAGGGLGAAERHHLVSDVVHVGGALEKRLLDGELLVLDA